jgi:hypothetical protein
MQQHKDKSLTFSSRSNPAWCNFTGEKQWCILIITIKTPMALHNICLDSLEYLYTCTINFLIPQQYYCKCGF